MEMSAREMLPVIVRALDSKKGGDIRALYTADQTTLADYFVICTGTSSTQIKALSDAVEEAMDKVGEKVHHIEGHRGGQWTLMDYSCVVVHIFTEEAREFYSLERLWSDAAPVDVSPYLIQE